MANTRTPKPVPDIDNETRERFMSKVQKTETCWIWQGGKSSGYGYIEIKSKTVRTNRAAWKIFFGDIPLGMVVCHRCDNPSCVNPDHLFLGSQKDNMQDMMQKGRSTHGEKNGRSKLTLEQVREIRYLRSQGYSLGKLAIMFNYHKSNIVSIVSNRIWKDSFTQGG